jgi:uncharacterized protein
MQFLAQTGRFAAHIIIRTYQLTLSSIAGTHCRHLPSCSSYMDEAIARHGLWAGGAMGIARLCRCHPWGTDGFDPVPEALPRNAHWWQPWAYGRWRGSLYKHADAEATQIGCGGTISRNDLAIPKDS